MSARPENLASHSNAGGHTLIELMVAILIGLIMVLVSFQVLAVFEGNKRTTTAMNDALQSGNYSMFSIDTLIRSSGTGLKQYGDYAGYGCPLNYTSANGVTVSAGAISIPAASTFGSVFTTAGAKTLRLAPAVIFPSATAQGSDVLMLMLGGGGFSESPNPTTSNNAKTDTSVTPNGGLIVENTVGYTANEWVLLGTAGIAQCMITTVDPSYTSYSSVDNVFLPLAAQTIGSASVADYTNGSGNVMALGSGPAANFVLYGVGANDTLYSMDLLNNLNVDQLVSDDVVMMKAIYQVSSTGFGGPGDTWVAPTATGAIDYSPKAVLAGTAAASNLLRQIRSIRVAMIVRAPLAERTDSSGKNSYTTGTVLNSGTYQMFSSINGGALTQTWTVPSDQLNYRYRVLEATIPIRDSTKWN